VRYILYINSVIDIGT